MARNASISYNVTRNAKILAKNNTA